MVGLDAAGAARRARRIGLDGAAERLVHAEARVAAAEDVLERAAEALARRRSARECGLGLGIGTAAATGATGSGGAAVATGACCGWSRGRNSGQSTIESSSKPGGRQTGRTMFSLSGPRTWRP